MAEHRRLDHHRPHRGQHRRGVPLHLRRCQPALWPLAALYRPLHHGVLHHRGDIAHLVRRPDRPQIQRLLGQGALLQLVLRADRHPVNLHFLRRILVAHPLLAAQGAAYRPPDACVPLHESFPRAEQGRQQQGARAVGVDTVPDHRDAHPIVHPLLRGARGAAGGLRQRLAQCGMGFRPIYRRPRRLRRHTARHLDRTDHRLPGGLARHSHLRRAGRSCRLRLQRGDGGRGEGETAEGQRQRHQRDDARQKP